MAVLLCAQTMAQRTVFSNDRFKIYWSTKKFFQLHNLDYLMEGCTKRKYVHISKKNKKIKEIRKEKNKILKFDGN